MTYNKISNVLADGGERGPTRALDNSKPHDMMSVREKASRERNYIQSRAKTTTNEPATVRASLTPIGNDSEGASMSEAADEPQVRSEEHTSELQSLMRISYAVVCLKKI